jgi:hypothetical protein
LLTTDEDNICDLLPVNRVKLTHPITSPVRSSAVTNHNHTPDDPVDASCSVLT